MAVLPPSPGTGAVLYDVTGLASATDESDTYLLPLKSPKDEIIVQVDISNGQADVMLEGRVSDEAAWVPALAAVIDEVTGIAGAALQTLSYVPQLRALITNATSSPDIRIEIYHGG